MSTVGEVDNIALNKTSSNYLDSVPLFVKFSVHSFDYSTQVASLNVVKSNVFRSGVDPLEARLLLDSGANCSAVSDSSRLKEAKFGVNIPVQGSTGLKNSNVIGFSKVLNFIAVLIEGIKFDIVALSQIEETHNIITTHLNRGLIFAVHKTMNEYLLFCLEDGLYIARSSFDNAMHPFEVEALNYPILERISSEQLFEDMTVSVTRSARPSVMQSVENCDRDYAVKELSLHKVSHKVCDEVMKIRSVHLVMGHPMEVAMRRLIYNINKKIAINKEHGRSRRDFLVPISDDAIKWYFIVFEKCTTCAMAKMTKSENQFRSSFVPIEIGDAVHVDLIFYDMQQLACCLISKDEVSGYTMVVHLSNKSARSLNSGIAFIKAYYFQFRHDLKNIYADRDSAITNKSLGPLQVGVINETTNAHNNVAERFARTLKDITNSVKADLPYTLPDIFYGKLVQWCCMSCNMYINSLEKSPFSIFHNGRDYSLDQLLWPFGTIVVARRTDSKKKSDLKAPVCVVVGKDPISDSTYLLYDLIRGTFFHASKIQEVTHDKAIWISVINNMSHVKSFEISSKLLKPDKPESSVEDFQDIIDEEDKVKPDVHPSEHDANNPDATWKVQTLLYTYYKKGKKKNDPQIKMFHVKWQGWILIDRHYDLSESELLDANFSSAELNIVPTEKIYNLKFSLHNTIVMFDTKQLTASNFLEKETPSLQDDYLCEDDLTISEIMLDKVLMTDNMSIRQAKKVNYDMACESIKLELNTILEFKTWIYTHKCDLSAEELNKTIISFMFLKNKYGVNNTLKLIKARLVAGGHMQDLTMIDPETISASTLRTASFNTLLNYATFNKVKLTILDVRSAYLQCSLPPDTIIHMKLSADIVEILITIDPSVEKYKDEKGEVYVVLKQALYGLVQSAKLWYLRLSQVLAELGYHPLPKNIDGNVFIKVLSDGIRFFIGVFVDDLGLLAHEIETRRVIDHLTKVFGTLKIQEGDKVSWLGIDIVRNVEEGWMTLSQVDYIERCLVKFATILKVDKFKESQVPARKDLFATASQNFKKENLNIDMLSIVMSIAYLSQRTRPDLQAIVAYFTTRSFHYDPQDIVDLKKLIGYILKTKDKVLRLSPTELKLYVLSDASYGIHVKKNSHTGIIASLSYNRLSNNIDGFVIANSVMQKLVAQSSAEAELIAQAEALKRLLWLSFLLEEMGVKRNEPMTIFFQDNMAAIHMAEVGSGAHKHTKHICHRYFLINNHLESDNIKMEHLHTDLMVADLLTKVIIGDKLVKLTKNILNE